MPIVFRAKTSDAYVLKILFELLQNNVRKACFELSADGIKLSMPDSHHHISINLDLQSENFSVYKFKEDKRYIGINLVHLHKMLKTIKKKDSLTLFIDDNEPTLLGIKVYPKENNGRVTTSKVTLHSMQYIDTEFPTGYGKPVIVPSSEYQKMTKEINSIGSTITIYSKDFFIKFLSDPSNTYYKNVTFGENEDEDDEDEECEDNEEYIQEFKTEMLNRISKIAGLSQNMQIFPMNGLPLLFKSSVGSLGKISIYVKSKEQIENDEHNTPDSDYDSETEEDEPEPVKNIRGKK